MATKNILKDYKVSEVEMLRINLKNKNNKTLNVVFVTKLQIFITFKKRF